MSPGSSWAGDAGLGSPPSGSLFLALFFPHQFPEAAVLLRGHMMSVSSNVGDINLGHWIKCLPGVKLLIFPFVINKPFMEKGFETMKISHFPSNSPGCCSGSFCGRNLLKDKTLKNVCMALAQEVWILIFISFFSSLSCLGALWLVTSQEWVSLGLTHQHRERSRAMRGDHVVISVDAGKLVKFRSKWNSPTLPVGV